MSEWYKVYASKKFVEEKIADIKFPEQKQADWNQNDETALDYIKNKTHYDTRVFEEFSYEFDGVLEGKEYVDLDRAYFVKVSNTVPENINEIKEVTVTIQTPDGISTDVIEISQMSDNMYGNDIITIACKDNTDIGMSFTKGIYVFSIDNTMYVTKLSYNVVISGELKELDEKFVSYKPGLKVEGKEFTVNEETVIASNGAEVFNDYYNIATGEHSHAEGISTIASGDYSHAEGGYTTASRHYSHAEGGNTIASGGWSHAEGKNTTASGTESHAEGSYTTSSGANGAHAEGWGTIASGDASHAEGWSTIASGDFGQHVQGKFNIEDTNNKYAHIVGNGTNTDPNNPTRSNAHTLDWEGNAWYKGDIYVGGTGQDDTTNVKKLATEDSVPKISYGTTDLTAGISALPKGTFYFVYE